MSKKRDIFLTKLKTYIDKHNLNLSDLDSLTSRSKIEVSCYHCGVKVFKIINNLLKSPETPPRCRVCGGKASNTGDSRSKSVKTCLRKYGVSNPTKDSKIKDKIKKTCLEKYGKESTIHVAREACNKKYKGKNPFEVSEVKEQIKKTCLRKYGGINKKQADLLLKNNVTSEKELFNKLVTFLEEHKVNCNDAKAKRYFKTEGVVLTRLLNKYDRRDLLNRFGSKSQYETEILKFLKENIPDKIIRNSRSVISPLELDLYIPAYKLAIEFHGLYWHSDKILKNKKAHLRKRELCREKDITLLQFYENEWKNKPAICKSIILNRLNLGTNRKVYARNTYIANADGEIRDKFLENNHLMGTYRSGKSIGLFDKSTKELVNILIYKKYKDGIEIARYATLLNTNVVGGLSKLLTYIERGEKPKFFRSFVDLRYHTGVGLAKLGFKLRGISLGWRWTDYKNTFNRLYCRANMDSRNLTEKEYAQESKLFKIYDAGQAKFVKSL